MKNRKILIAVIVILVLAGAFLAYRPIQYRVLKSNIEEFKKDPGYTRVTGVLKDSIALWKSTNKNNWRSITYTSDGVVLFNEAHDKCEIIYCVEFTDHDTTFVGASNAQGVLKANAWHVKDAGGWIQKDRNRFKGSPDDLVKLALRKLIRTYGIITWNFKYNNQFIDKNVRL